MSGATRPNKTLRVLLVDDSPQRRAALETSLAEVGCEVVGFVSRSDDLRHRIETLDPEVLTVCAAHQSPPCADFPVKCLPEVWPARSIVTG